MDTGGYKNQQKQVDEQKIAQFVSRVMHDWDTTVNCGLTFIGDKLGLYKAMAKANGGKVTSQELATITRTNERYIRDWLAAQASSGYIDYDSNSDRFVLPKEHAAVLADESSSAYMAGGFQLVISILKIEPKVTRAFRTGGGFEWGEYDPGVFEGQARLNATLYKTNLVNHWIPALDGIEERLLRGTGATVADIGCGYGISTLIMAKAYPNASFIGFDNHPPSIEYASKMRAEEKGLGNEGRLKFEIASSAAFPRYGGYDLVTFFDCFHDMADPYGVARHVRSALRPGGSLMLVEMVSSDSMVENIRSPLGMNGYGGSVFVCLPNALAKKNTSAIDPVVRENDDDIVPLGGMPGISKFERIIRDSGFSKFRCALNDGFSMILEAKP